MHPPIQGVQDAFLTAMAAGWADSTDELPGKDFVGMKVVPFVHGDYQVVDGYQSPPYDGGHSTGMTMIYHQDVPVWTMHYGGRYTKSAIPFLKECLRRTYVTQRRFYGGRGPAFVRGQRFTYFNNVRNADFTMFDGEEFIFDTNDQFLGSHWYKGHLLFSGE